MDTSSASHIHNHDSDHDHDHDHEHTYTHSHHHSEPHPHDHGSHDRRASTIQPRHNGHSPLLTSGGWKTTITPAGKQVITPTASDFPAKYEAPEAKHPKPAHDPSAERSKFTKALLPYTSKWPILHAVMTEKDSRRIFYFMSALRNSLNFFFMAIQAFYGYVTDSLGLLSDSIHMFFDCVALGVGLFASVASKWPPSSRFPYGFGKVETLSGFANGVFLVLISVEIMIEAFERIVEGRETKRLAELFIVSSLGLAVNLVGMAAFGHHHHGHGHDHGCGGHSHQDHAHDHDHDHGHSHTHSHSHSDEKDSHSHDHEHDHKHEHSNEHAHHDHHHHSHSHDNENMIGIYLHILADTLGSGAVIVSTALTHYFPWSGWDPLASFIIAVLIIGSAIPLVKSSARRLLLTIPDEIEYSLRDTLSGITGLRGVAHYSVPKFWIDDRASEDGAPGGRLMGVMHVVAVRGADMEDVRDRVRGYFSERGIDITLQVEREGDSTCWCGVGKSPLSPLSPLSPTVGVSQTLKAR
ncbi:hypothetical protein VMCG_05016 [Cytospora schulzeri]|uniref:Zinc transporter n=1 Tax=Cytospora schulzeri TaxID=448051 RepID=A0A423WM67_9PEZI|nr:hypothetical protein VMCG_05016 [Valsa malicola]